MIELVIIAVCMFIVVIGYALYLERQCNKYDISIYFNDCEENDRADEYMYRIMMKYMLDD